MKKCTRFVAMLVAVALCFSVLPAFAADGSRDYLKGSFVFGDDSAPEQYRIVTIGDSTTNGFYLNDYACFTDGVVDAGKDYVGIQDRTNAHQDPIDDFMSLSDPSFRLDASTNYGLLNNASHKAVAYQLGEYVKSVKGNDCQVVSTSLAVEGMRSDEVHALLDKKYTGDALAQINLESYEKWFQTYLGMSARDAFQSSVKDADCIVLDNVMNNFFLYCIYRLGHVLNGDMETFNDSYKDVKGAYAIGSVVTFARDTVLGLVKQAAELAGIELDTEIVEELTDMVLYSYCDFCSNFTENVRLIRKMNPDARLIACGAYHTMTNIKIKLGDIYLDLDPLFNTFMDLLDAFIEYGCMYHDEYAFVSLKSGISSFSDELRNAETVEDIYPAFGNVMDTNLKVYYESYYKPYCQENGIEEGSRLTEDEFVQNGKTVLLEAIKKKSLDIIDALKFVLGEEIETSVMEAIHSGSLENAPAGLSELMNVFTRLVVGFAVGIHPGVKGAETKSQLVKKAWQFLEDGGCMTQTSVYYAGGKYTMKLNGKTAGQFTVYRYGAGWSVYDNAEGKYLAFDSAKNTLKYSGKPFAWSYNGGFYANGTVRTGYGMFYQKSVPAKFYLNMGAGGLSVSRTIQTVRLFASHNAHTYGYGGKCVLCGKAA